MDLDSYCRHWQDEARRRADFYLHWPHQPYRDDISILVAGCGTGLNPLSDAVKYPNARITAIDISRRSLAFAMRKAEELGIGNVDFYQGDILELGTLDRRFDVVICGGVLHHMADPLQGWAVLRGLLVPEYR